MNGQQKPRIAIARPQQILRKEMTDAEHALWNILRGRQVLGLKFRRQHPFNGYFLDFVCLEKKLVIEVDGGQHIEQIKHDEQRTRALSAAGFVVIRLWNDEVLKDIEAVTEIVWKTLQDITDTHPHPRPPLEGEGGL